MLTVQHMRLNMSQRSHYYIRQSQIGHLAKRRLQPSSHARLQQPLRFQLCTAVDSRAYRCFRRPYKEVFLSSASLFCPGFWNVINFLFFGHKFIGSCANIYCFLVFDAFSLSIDLSLVLCRCFPARFNVSTVFGLWISFWRCVSHLAYCLTPCLLLISS